MGQAIMCMGFICLWLMALVQALAADQIRSRIQYFKRCGGHYAKVAIKEPCKSVGGVLVQLGM